MFEIPDDDDNFWEDLPLNDISNENITTTTRSEPQVERKEYSRDVISFTKEIKPPAFENQKKQSHSSGIPNGKLSFIQKTANVDEYKTLQNQDNVTGKLSHKQHHASGIDLPVQPSRILVPNTQEAILSEEPSVRGRTSSSDSNRHDRTQSSDSSNSLINNRTSNKRKRKFPGPAGLLPKLGIGHTLDSPDVSKVKVDSVSPEQAIEKNEVILSSQSGEDAFNDRPWTTLMKDLGKDGQDILHRFSLASSLLKAKKKQLPRGKVPFVIALIETLEWPGGDASVSLKDKSGKMQGTIHQSLMKEYECDLQPGSVLVLRQVSVISPTSRNHYLNITPANVVSVYCNKSEGLHQIRFVDKEKPLPRVLKSMEKELIADITPQRPRIPEVRTPQMTSNIGRAGIPGLGSSGVQGLGAARSGLFTPQNGSSFTPGFQGNNRIRTPRMASSMTVSYMPQRGSAHTLNPQQFSTPDPRQRSVSNYNFTPQSRTPSHVNVPFNNNNGTPRVGYHENNKSCVTPGNITQQQSTSSITNVSNPYKFKPRTSQAGYSAPGEHCPSSIPQSHSTGSSEKNSTPQYTMNQQPPNSVNASLSPGASTTVTKSCNISRSVVLDSTVTTVPVICTANSAKTSTYNSLQSRGEISCNTMKGPTNVSSETNTPTRKGFKFKSTKSITSPNILSSATHQSKDSNIIKPCPTQSTVISQAGSSHVCKSDTPVVKDTVTKDNSNMEVESLWQDDLSDDLLSQLSDEIM